MRALVTGVAAMLSLLACGGRVLGQAPVAICSDWLMQDAARVKETGEVISRVGFAPPVYAAGAYAAPATAMANRPTSIVISPAVRYFVAGGGGGGGGGGGTQWPVQPEKNRPTNSSQWAQAPGPASPAWYRATVPGTVLTTLVNNNVYPEPLSGENNRPNIIPESLSRASYWFRSEFLVPAGFAGRQIRLNFDGINYSAEVWVNGTKVGTIQGAFIRAEFNVTAWVTPGGKAAVAVLIRPPPHPGDPWEKTVANQRGPNGGGNLGPLGQDGPTFIASIGWDWIPGIRDRDTGIWQSVSLSQSGPVIIKDPSVVTDLPLPRIDSADVSIAATVENTTGTAQTGVLSGKLGEISFRSATIVLPPGQWQLVRFNPQNTAQLRVSNPKLWWPNGFGHPYLYPLHLRFDIDGVSSDAMDFKVGIRKVAYFVDGSKNLTLSVNGVRVFAKGGNWGMDEAMKRIPRQRLEAQIKMHKLAHYDIIRNWAGQSTSEDFYDLCDQYGIMVWDEFFEANPANGLNPLDADVYLSNVRDKVLRYRNHPCIVVWCGRNEGAPPPAIEAGNARIIGELDPGRYYQSSSTAGNGVVSGGGGYGWRVPRRFYGIYPAFNTEVGSASIPTLEAIESWMPETDWFDKNFPNDDWAEHDLVTGNGSPAGNPFHLAIARRFGPYATLADFVRKAQMADFEAFRAMYEARLFRLFNPCTAILTWMSNPAQPCLVWQIYDYSLEPFASYFAVQKACEPVHIMMTQDDFHVGVVNNTPAVLRGMKYRLRIVNLDGASQYDRTTAIAACPPSRTLNLGASPFPGGLSAVHFVKLDLLDSENKVLSDNFYWRENTPDDLTAMDKMPDVQLDAGIVRHDAGGNCLLDVTLSNPTAIPAVMAHLQLRNGRTHQRVLPVYYSENYVSLLPGEERTIGIEAAAADIGSDRPLVMLDGWNVTTTARTFPDGGGASIATNEQAHVIR